MLVNSSIDSSHSTTLSSTKILVMESWNYDPFRKLDVVSLQYLVENAAYPRSTEKIVDDMLIALRPSNRFPKPRAYPTLLLQCRFKFMSHVAKLF